MESDEQLMSSYLAGDQSAFRELHERHRPMIRRIVARRVFRGSEVDDLVQQTFMQLHAARTKYRIGEPLRPWLCTIAFNVCRDHGRRSNRHPETSCDMDELTFALPSLLPGERHELAAPLANALEALPTRTRAILVQHFVADRTLAEIARDLGENPVTVRVRMHRCCQQLRASIALCNSEAPNAVTFDRASVPGTRVRCCGLDATARAD